MPRRNSNFSHAAFYRGFNQKESPLFESESERKTVTSKQSTLQDFPSVSDPLSAESLLESYAKIIAMLQRMVCLSFLIFFWQIFFWKIFSDAFACKLWTDKKFLSFFLKTLFCWDFFARKNVTHCPTLATKFL